MLVWSWVKGFLKDIGACGDKEPIGDVPRNEGAPRQQKQKCQGLLGFDD